MPTYEERRQLDTVRNPKLYEQIRLAVDHGKPVASLAAAAAAEGITVRQLYRIRKRVEALIQRSGRDVPANPHFAREVAQRAARAYWDAMELDQ